MKEEEIIKERVFHDYATIKEGIYTTETSEKSSGLHNEIHTNDHISDPYDLTSPPRGGI